MEVDRLIGPAGTGAYRPADCGSNDPAGTAEVVTRTRDPQWEAHRANLRARDRAVAESAARRSDCHHLAHCKCWATAKAEAFAVLNGLLQDGWTFAPPARPDPTFAWCGLFTVHGPHDTCHGWGEGQQT